MNKEQGNLDDVLPPEPLGTRLAHGLLFEFAFWIVVGLAWLAFEGGVVGLVIVAIVAVLVGVAWRDISRRSKNPIQHTPPPND
jgi:hypothetical protein